MDVEMNVVDRARAHAALGDAHRVAIVDELRLGDLTPSQLSTRTGLASNLLAFHLDVLEDAGLVRRGRSQGDARRRYVTLRGQALARLLEPAPAAYAAASRVLFVCTRNAARSPLAAALWRQRTGREADSAGHRPAAGVHPLTRRVAAESGLDLGEARPRGYDEVDGDHDLVISVCDRAHEAPLPFDAPRLHWSVPDPLEPRPSRPRLEEALVDLRGRVDRLATAVGAA